MSSPDAPQARGLCAAGSYYWSCSESWFGCCSMSPCEIGYCPDAVDGMRVMRASASPLNNNEDSADPTEITLFPFPSSKSSDDKKDQETTALSLPTAVPAIANTSPETETVAPFLPSVENTMTTMTDSGITHTIPNNSVVTVIMHTTITTRRPSPTASGTDSATTTNTGSSAAASSRSHTNATSRPMNTAGHRPGSYHPQGLSSAAIAGIAVGGTILLVILGVIAVFVRRRRRQNRDDASDAFSSGFNEDDAAVRREEVPEEKNYQPPVSTHTTGTQGSSDPFAPFGGRADDPYRPHSGTFEMDGTSVAPVELPVMENSSRGHGQATAASGRVTPVPRLDPVQERSDTPADPRANLDSVQTEGGKPAYINHWNQYRNLGQEQQS